MAKVCANCGMVLPREDARFCGICGTLVASHSANVQLEKASQQSISPATPVFFSSTISSRQYEPREQMAHWSFVNEKQSVGPAKLPGWMSKLETSFEKRADAPVSPLQKSPQRPLRVKVWQAEKGAGVEKLDTVPLETQMRASPEAIPEQRALTEMATAQLPAAIPDAPTKTNLQQTSPPVQTQRTMMPPPPITPVFTLALAVPEQNTHILKQPPATPVFAASPAGSSSREAFIAPKVESKGKKRTLPILSLIVLTLLLVGGGVWIWHYQPFSVATITQTQQQLSDARVGVSLLYPTGWQVRVDHTAPAIFLYDSSHTARFTIQTSPQQNGDVAQYLKQQAARQNMTGIKSMQPLSFAGVSWQQIQGSSVQQGANYTEMLLATMHRNELMIIVQLAPQSIYSDEEKSIFSSIHTSLKFI